MRKKMHHGGGGPRNNNGGGGSGGSGGRRRFIRKPGGGNPGGGNRFHNEDSEAVNPRMRKQAQTNREKYMTMGRDALSSGDRVEAEYYFQHADHYLRIMNQIDAQFAPRPQHSAPEEAQAGGEVGEHAPGDETQQVEAEEEECGGAPLASILPAPKMAAE